MPYMGYLGLSRCERFQQVCSGIGYINHGEFGFGQDIIFQETGQLLKILVQTRVTGICHSKIYIKKPDGY